MNKALVYQEPAGVKLSSLIPSLVEEEELAFLAQLGVKYCYAWLDDDQVGYDFIASLRDRVARHGITLYNAANRILAKSPSVHLALPDRDKYLDMHAELLRNLGRAGVHTTTITWEPNGTLSTSPTEGVCLKHHGVTRGGALTRMIDMDIMNAWGPTHGRIYEKEEIWENFAYFAKYIVPVAEEAKVRISLHPNDPPVPMVGGIATLITCREDYERAFRIADSDFFGMEFCCGCWLEGGKEGFGDMLEGIRDFVARGKVFIVHFRNVSSPLPKFIETFVDDGYQDMYEPMRAFVESGYNGSLVLDHSPHLAGGRLTEVAYAIGYLKGLLRAGVGEPGRRDCGQGQD